MQKHKFYKYILIYNTLGKNESQPGCYSYQGAMFSMRY